MSNFDEFERSILPDAVNILIYSVRQLKGKDRLEVEIGRVVFFGGHDYRKRYNLIVAYDENGPHSYILPALEHAVATSEHAWLQLYRNRKNSKYSTMRIHAGKHVIESVWIEEEGDEK